MFEQIITKAQRIKNPLEAAFFLWVKSGVFPAFRGWEQASEHGRRQYPIYAL
jgi:hypothetical protein